MLSKLIFQKAICKSQIHRILAFWPIDFFLGVHPVYLSRLFNQEHY